jgi:hypothetical protein
MYPSTQGVKPQYIQGESFLWKTPPMSEERRIESKVRLDNDLAELLRRIEFERKLTRQQLITDAIWFYIERGLGDAAPTRPAASPPPSVLNPQTAEERLLVAGLLLLWRDKREIAKGVKEIVGGLLSNWMEKAKGMLNGGERSA